MNDRSDLTRIDLERLDREDPLGFTRELFDLPEGVLYFDGNSLGPQTRRSVERLETVRQQWHDDLIEGWNAHRWIHLPASAGARIAPLIGAAPHEVTVADSTSVNLFKAVAAARRLRPDRHVVLAEKSDFPSDLYVLQSLTEQLSGDLQLRLVESSGLEASIHDDVAVVSLTHVNFRTGAMHDLREITRRVHDAGAIMVWDLSHSTGAVPLDLRAAGVDLAIGCGYKFLNGGPGAPAFLFAAESLHPDLVQPLAGWMGHAAPFDFDPEYRPAPGIDRMLCGTPSVLAMATLDAALEAFEDVDMQQVRRKSVRLGESFLDLVDQCCAGHGLRRACPPDPETRGSQICLAHENGYRIIRALADRGVIGDFRAPDVLRFGLTPLYQRYVDVWDAVEVLRDVMESEAWRDPRYERRGLVT